jgi:hypothetical protein
LFRVGRAAWRHSSAEKSALSAVEVPKRLWNKRKGRDGEEMPCYELKNGKNPTRTNKSPTGQRNAYRSKRVGGHKALREERF